MNYLMQTQYRAQYRQICRKAEFKKKKTCADDSFPSTEHRFNLYTDMNIYILPRLTDANRRVFSIHNSQVFDIVNQEMDWHTMYC